MGSGAPCWLEEPWELSAVSLLPKSVGGGALGQRKVQLNGEGQGGGQFQPERGWNSGRIFCIRLLVLCQQLS